MVQTVGEALSSVTPDGTRQVTVTSTARWPRHQDRAPKSVPLDAKAACATVLGTKSRLWPSGHLVKSATCHDLLAELVHIFAAGVCQDHAILAVVNLQRMLAHTCGTVLRGSDHVASIVSASCKAPGSLSVDISAAPASTPPSSRSRRPRRGSSWWGSALRPR